MFTGLIEETGSVVSIKESGEGKILEVKGDMVLRETKRGDSISINGACQTVVSMTENTFSVFVSRVTLAVTTFGDFKPGRIVNLERALTLSTRLGGHIVQGHVDFTGKVKKISRDSQGVEIDISVSEANMKYIVEKGSIAVDGISLTVVEIEKEGFRLYLIPETLEVTNIGSWKNGDIVNIETDILARYVERILQFGRIEQGDEPGANDESLLKKLAENGYL
ncbi:MAG TPA: riboflavin synthase [Spirochaetota bacterium]|nr:riboflavin synthase [Spirochaetota bacterium]